MAWLHSLLKSKGQPVAAAIPQIPRLLQQRSDAVEDIVVELTASINPQETIYA